MPSLLLAVFLPVAATLIGGYLVLRTKQDLRPWLSLSGGVLLALSFLDLVPEAFEHGSLAQLEPAVIGATILISILFFHLLDKLFDYHGHEGHEHACDNRSHIQVSTWTRVSGMAFHSFLDGLAVGGGFASSARLGLLVTVAVMLHKFTDGMSTVTIMRARENPNPTQRRPLIALGLIILLPFVGLALGRLLSPSDQAMAFFFAALAGLFIHLPLSELLPQAHEGKTSRVGLLLTVIGIAIMGGIRYLTP